jgi:hypothetical protein
MEIVQITTNIWSRNSAMGSEFESQWSQEFSFLHIVQSGIRAHTTSYAVGTVVSFPGSKAA